GRRLGRVGRRGSVELVVGSIGLVGGSVELVVGSFAVIVSTGWDGLYNYQDIILSVFSEINAASA
ncbi:MAG TPA: hypothetical protein PLW09_14705, partial [Candidatus Kapabacteria bacterium]|nr:hypothetical protein [Candidatus Kapabacteria bacterium]